LIVSLLPADEEYVVLQKQGSTSESVSFKDALSGVFSSLKLKYLDTNINLFLTTGLPGAAAVGFHSAITSIILLQF
jgi:hypothetical protein